MVHWQQEFKRAKNLPVLKSYNLPITVTFALADPGTVFSGNLSCSSRRMTLAETNITNIKLTVVRVIVVQLVLLFPLKYMTLHLQQIATYLQVVSE